MSRIAQVGVFDAHTDPAAGLCPGFSRLGYVAECPGLCRYCYVPNVYARFDNRPPDLEPDAVERTADHVGRWLKRQSQPTVLNTGELSDSWAPEIAGDLSVRLIELFRGHLSDCVLLTVTKFPEVALRRLATVAPHPQAIVSVSAGGWDEIEPGAVPLRRRLSALVDLAEMGWRIRLRIDPMSDAWVGDTLPLTHVAALAAAERVTVGFPRFGHAQRASCAPSEWTVRGSLDHTNPFRNLVRCDGDSFKPWRPDLSSRITTLRWLLRAAAVQSVDPGKFALCKEPAAVWQSGLGEMPNRIECNCTL